MNKDPFIVVVDDDAATCRSSQRLLRANGFLSQTYTSAAAFLSSPDLSHTDCLILDVQMPHQNGLELQDCLRAQGHRLPIIFMTGYMNSKDRERAFKGGAVEMLEKPFDEKQLIGRIHSVLASR